MVQRGFLERFDDFLAPVVLVFQIAPPKFDVSLKASTEVAMEEPIVYFHFFLKPWFFFSRAGQKKQAVCD